MRQIPLRTGHITLRPAIFALLLMLCLTAPTHAAEEFLETETAVIKETVEDYLYRYDHASLLYEPQDLRTGTVADPGIITTPENEARVYRLSDKDTTLADMRENIAFVEKKADYYAGMRQMQDIYRKDLTLAYIYEELTFTDDTCLVKLTEAAGFQYMDSGIPSVNESFYTINLIRLDGQWRIATITDGSSFDSLYKKQGGSFDVPAALKALAESLETENCSLIFPYLGSTAPDRLYYDGASAAAYAYTYARRTPEDEKPAYYNPLFFSYAGKGGDCMNYGSQCVWAGFGGSETAASVNSHTQPMDTSGDYMWYGRSASGESVSHSWISCQAFRTYLTDTKDASGAGGSNAASDPGIYATILTVGDSAPITGVEPQELVGAVAHVDGASGSYGHTIVLTAATGNQRSQIWFCGHTKNVTNVKLGDYYTCSMKVYIPRYMRAGVSQSNTILPTRIQPVTVGETSILSARAANPQYRMWLNVTAPDGQALRTGFAENWNVSEAAYTFDQIGLYQVDCCAMEASQDSPVVSVTYYVRCFAPAEAPGSALPEDEENTALPDMFGIGAPEGQEWEEAEPEESEPQQVPRPEWL